MNVECNNENETYILEYFTKIKRIQVCMQCNAGVCGSGTGDRLVTRESEVPSGFSFLGRGPRAVGS